MYLKNPTAVLSWTIFSNSTEIMFSIFKRGKNKSQMLLDMEAKSDAELKQIVGDHQESLLRQFILILELEKRVHEIKFHGRTGDSEKLEAAIVTILADLL